MKPLAQGALAAAVEDRVKFYPSRWKKTYVDWMENIRDWCISRQIWWGHRIPVWYCKDCKKTIVAEETPVSCPGCKSKNIVQDDDVLDTWFSSWLWPFSIMGWPDTTKLMEKFYPTDVLVTAPEILFFWVARMIMAGLHFTGKLPFTDVFLNATVRDKTGRKMSKSLGNAIDPLEVISKSGADALRFSLIMITSQGAAGTSATSSGTRRAFFWTPSNRNIRFRPCRPETNLRRSMCGFCRGSTRPSRG
jgi:valyl-tRNA synthetase